MPYIKLNDINMYYESHGQGEPLVLISGFSADHLAWLSVIKLLARHHQTIIFDNRGSGFTDVPDYPYTINMMANDVVALMDSLDITKAHVIGHSMGGMIAQMIAINHMDRLKKLILMNSSAKVNMVTRAAFDFNRKLFEKGLSAKIIFENFIPWGFSNNFLEQDDNLSLLLEFNRNRPMAMTYTGFIQQYAAIKQFDSNKILNQIVNKTLVIASEKDIITPPNESYFLTKEIPNSHLSLLLGVGHIPQIECPERFVDVVLDFLN